MESLRLLQTTTLCTLFSELKDLDVVTAGGKKLFLVIKFSMERDFDSFQALSRIMGL